MARHDLRGKDFADLMCTECKSTTFNVCVVDSQRFGGGIVKATCTECGSDYCLSNFKQ